jgi:hypothetical protein
MDIIQITSVNNVVYNVCNKAVSIRLKRNTSKINNIRWCVTTDININEKRSGESRSFILINFY